jgi:glycosyltransferase involved in cell wall biosynthesis
VRVGISLLTLAPGDLGGSETYARQLVKALSTVGMHEYAVFVPARAKDAAGQLPAIEVKEPPVAKGGPARIAAMALSTFRSKRVQTKLETVDVVHYALTVPLPRTTTPTVVTLHDVQHRDLPDFFGPAKRSFRRIAYDRATQSAEAVVVTSEFVRGRALEQLQLDPARVHVVPHAINHTLFRPGDEEREPILLYPARAWPHKNHTRLFEAFAILRKHDPKLRLILTGGGLERLGQLPEGVERWGVVPAGELASLEAMACGCPVAASNVAAIPEVCGDAAVLFDPNDPEAIAQAVLDADARANELHEKGLARVAEFTWEASARKHDDVYTAALEP